MEYWKECISEAFEDAGIVANDDQVKTVANWVDGAHENYGLAHGYECIPNPLESENKRLKQELANERDKEPCPECHGSGRIVTKGPSHSADMTCSKCRGEGKTLYGM